MPRDAPFWRNLTIISVAHLAIIVALVRSNVEAKRPNLQTIVWMSSSVTEAAAKTKPAGTERALEKTPPPATLNSGPEKQQEQRPTSAASSIQLPVEIPSPAPSETPIPKPTTEQNPSPRVTPKATPKPTRKKLIAATATPKPSSKKKAPSVTQEKENENQQSPTKVASPNANASNSDKSGSNASGGTAKASEFSWYGKMLHDRFYSEWIQPKTSTAVGAKISAMVRVRIEKDGRISNFTIVKPSGNVVVDESVAAVGRRVTQVDPLPTGLDGGTHYEVNIAFELNPEP